MAMEAPRKKSAKGVVLSPPSSSSSCSITNLPDPILMEILYRLPIKTLVTCKRVCKSWLRVIRDPEFSELHQARAPTEVCFQQDHGVKTTKLYMANFNLLSNFDVKLDTLLELPKFSFGPKSVLCYDKDRRESLYFANSCNGLLCYFGQYRKPVVWNPCTSEFIAFPAPNINECFPSCRGYGIGFSRKANKFKFFRFRGRKVQGSSAEPEVVVAEIYAIEKSYPWKIVGQVPFGYPSIPEVLSSGTFLQGTLHWLITDKRLSEISILAFNFEDDHFGRIQLPPNFAKTPWNSYVSSCREELGELGGCLFITEYTDEGVSVWLMKEYGVQASWTNLFCVGFKLMERYCVRDPMTKKICDWARYQRCLPISYMDNVEILMTCSGCLTTTVFFYNPVLKTVGVTGFCHSTVRVIAYRPSFVLLKDSMPGNLVHVIEPRSADSKQREMSTSHFWTPGVTRTSF